MFDLTYHHFAWICVCVSLKVTAQQLYPHGDAVHPAPGDDPDEAGENRRVDVVLHVVVVVCVSHESLDLKSERKTYIRNTSP